MIDVKEAAKIATAYFSELYHGKFQNLALEEFEMSEDEKFWKITLGYAVQGQHSMTSGSTSREFKTLTIEVENGRVLSMKSRKMT